MAVLDETHDPARRSFLASANAADADFPIQNLPYGVFHPMGGGDFRVGVAIGDRVVDVARLEGLMDSAPAAAAARACASPALNPLMQLGPQAWRALRRALSDRLGQDAAAARRDQVEACLLPMSAVEMALPVLIGDFTDFYASVFHATNAGVLMRPENPLLPNYKYIPVAYHSRVSSIRLSGAPVRRPRGQIKPPEAAAPIFAPSRRLDYEAELGVYVGAGSDLGAPVPIAQADGHIFGFCLLNDWSARDIQAWEYQPLGPFLGKNFASTVSAWVVTAEALQPYRTAAFRRPPGDPEPLPHLFDERDQAEGGLDITLETYLHTERMRRSGQPPHRLSISSFANTYWTVAQMLAHHTSNGCNLVPGDLIGSGTVSGPEPLNWGSLLELTHGGQAPITLSNGERRAFLEDGDEVILKGLCTRQGAPRIGFGTCRARVLPASGGADGP